MPQLAGLATALLFGGLVCHSVERWRDARLTAEALRQERQAIAREVRRFDADLKATETSLRQRAGLLSRQRDTPATAGAALALPRALAGSTPLAANSWILPRSRALQMHWPAIPDYLHPRRRLPQPSARVRFEAPVAGGNAPRWTPPTYDPTARRWLITVAVPYRREGRWAGTVGHDILLRDLLDTLSPPRNAGLARAQAITTAEGALLSGRHGLRSPAQRLPRRYLPFLEQSRGWSQVRLFASGEDSVLVAPIPTLSAYAVYRVSGGALRSSLRPRLSALVLARTALWLGAAAAALATLPRRLPTPLAAGNSSPRPRSGPSPAD